MTREEAKNIILGKSNEYGIYGKGDLTEALDMAIKALEQHPNIINASDIKQDDEWMQENEWDEIYKKETHENARKHTEPHECDCVSRQMAIDCFWDEEKLMRNALDIVKDIRNLPSVSPANAKDINVLATDCISRQAVLDCAYPYGYGLEPEGYRIDVEDVQNLPPVSPARPKGKWIDTGMICTNQQGYIIHQVLCSNCNGLAYFRKAFDNYVGANTCPNCGSYNGGEQK